MDGELEDLVATQAKSGAARQTLDVTPKVSLDPQALSTPQGTQA